MLPDVFKGVLLTICWVVDVWLYGAGESSLNRNVPVIIWPNYVIMIRNELTFVTEVYTGRDPWTAIQSRNSFYGRGDSQSMTLRLSSSFHLWVFPISHQHEVVSPFFK